MTSWISPPAPRSCGGFDRPLAAVRRGGPQRLHICGTAFRPVSAPWECRTNPAHKSVGCPAPDGRPPQLATALFNRLPKNASPPPRRHPPRSLELLFALGALDGGGALTADVGAAMARLPVDPMFGKVGCFVPGPFHMVWTSGLGFQGLAGCVFGLLACLLACWATSQNLSERKAADKALRDCKRRRQVLLASGRLGCSIEAMQVVGLVSSDGIFHNPR